MLRADIQVGEVRTITRLLKPLVSVSPATPTAVAAGAPRRCRWRPRRPSGRTKQQQADDFGLRQLGFGWQCSVNLPAFTVPE
jgi:hypothetical protein